MPRLRQANGLFWQCIAAAAVCALSQCSPHVVFTQPNNGDIIPNITSLEFKYEVVCAEDLTALVGILWTPLSISKSGTMIPLPKPFLLINLEAGSQAVMISLHPASNTSHVISESWLHFEIVPPGVPEINPVYASYTRASVAPDPPFLSLPLNVTFLSDTFVYDGMKTFLVDYIRVFKSFGARVTVMDNCCKLPDTYIAPYGNDSTRVGSAMLSAGAALRRHCLQCPLNMSVCRDGDFSPFVAYNGPLHTAETWEDVPQELRGLLAPIYTALVDQDVLLFSWEDALNRDPTRAGTLFQSQLAVLANPFVVRGADLGPSTTPAAGHARVADFITAPSHFIARTMRPPTGQPVIVMQPVLDGAMFAPKVNSTIEVAGLRLQESECMARYGKPIGGKLVGMIARVTGTKSPGLFIRAAALVSATQQNVRFVFVGPSDEKASTAVEHLVESLSLSKSAFGFLGFIPRAELPELYSCLDAIVFTSTHETFGISNLEAMTMGIPIVHFGVQGLQDYFIDGENSVLAREFTPEALAESVLSLLSSEERRVAIGTQAAAFVQRYLAAGVTSPRVAASILHMSNMGRLDPFVSLPLNGSVSALPQIGADGVSFFFKVYLFVSPVITDVSDALAKQIPEQGGANDSASLLALFNERQSGGASLCFSVDSSAPMCGEWSDPPPSVLLSLPPGTHTASSWVTRPSRSTKVFKSSLQFTLSL